MIENDEMFVLCLLSGAKEITGLTNPIEALKDDDAEKRLDEIMDSLYSNAIIHKDSDDNICIKDKYAKIAAVISFPDTFYVLEENEWLQDYFYIKGSVCAYMKSNDSPRLGVYDNSKDFTSDLINTLKLSQSAEVPINLHVSEDNFNKAVELFLSGSLLEATELIDAKYDIACSILEKFVQTDNIKNFSGFKMNQENQSKALFKVVPSDEGTWLFKFCNKNVEVCRFSAYNTISKILRF